MIHEDDRIFGEWLSPSTMGLGHMDWTIQLALQYSSLYTIQLVKNGQFRLVPTN